LSGSGLHEDILEAHRRGVKAYFTKPSEFSELERLVRLVAEHWSKAKAPELRERCH